MSKTRLQDLEHIYSMQNNPGLLRTKAGNRLLKQKLSVITIFPRVLARAQVYTRYLSKRIQVQNKKKAKIINKIKLKIQTIKF